MRLYLKAASEEIFKAFYTPRAERMRYNNHISFHQGVRMQSLFNEVASLDERCYKQFALSEDILMEHAAEGMARYIREHFERGSRVHVVVGPGNNGADGIALARLLHGDYAVTLMLPYGAKGAMSALQMRRARSLSVPVVEDLEPCDILVDALFGSGFSRAFDAKTAKLLHEMNDMRAFKLACDMPSGLHLDGTLEPETFTADTTLTMGALKRGMFSDAAKGNVGTVEVINLGIARAYYEAKSSWQLLDESDMTLPYRRRSDSHKGSYGHLGVICGEKEGAAVIAGSAALRFGTGLVTLISNEQVHIPYELMQSHLLSETTTAIALGMGLGQEFSEDELKSLLDNDLPLLLDADIFAHPMLCTLIERKNIVLTPHPKEFVRLLKTCGIADIDVARLQRERFRYVEAFSSRYPECVLLLKGANVIIAHNEHYFINPHGSNVLAKGGSGDVLAGLIAALLAQGSDPLEAAQNASLAHTALAKRYTFNNFSMTPMDLIEGIAHL